MSELSPRTPTWDRSSGAETAISSLDAGLQFRGYPLEDLVAEASFLEVAHLLLQGDLPNREELADTQASWLESPELEPDLAAWLETVPLHVPLGDVFRTGLSLLTQDDPRRHENTPIAIWQTSLRLYAQLPLLIAGRVRHVQARPLLALRDELTFAGNLYWLLTEEEPTAIAEQALDALLVCCAEHEFSPSTYAIRLAASVRSDFTSTLPAGVAVARGALHAGLAQQVAGIYDMLSSAPAAEMWAQATLQRQARLPGFWHRVYRDSDPRASVLSPLCHELAEENGNTALEEVAAAIENVVREEQQMQPAIIWPAMRILKHLNLAPELAVPLFCLSRMTGWAAHYLEQTQNTRPIRPRARYIGPPLRRYLSPEERG